MSEQFARLVSEYESALLRRLAAESECVEAEREFDSAEKSLVGAMQAQLKDRIVADDRLYELSVRGGSARVHRHTVDCVLAGTTNDADDWRKVKVTDD